MFNLKIVAIILLSAFSAIVGHALPRSFKPGICFPSESIQSVSFKNHYSNQVNSIALVYDSVRKELAFYRNGKAKFIVWSIYDDLQHERKKIVQKFRKNGKRRCIRHYEITLEGEMRIMYQIQFDPEGNPVGENYYVYDRFGILIQDDNSEDD
jgi:hypothetical protein